MMVLSAPFLLIFRIFPLRRRAGFAIIIGKRHGIDGRCEIEDRSD